MSKSKNRIGYYLAVLLTLVLVGAIESVRAEVVTHNFTGTVTSITGTPCSVSSYIGAAVQVSITYAPTPPGPNPVAGYTQPPPSGMSVVIGGASVQSGGYASLQVVNDAPSGFTVGAPCTFPFPVGPLDNINGFFNVGCGFMGFSLTDFTQTALPSTALPSSLNFGSFSQRVGCIWSGSSRVTFSVDEPVVDTDGDGVPDEVDNCPYVANFDQADADGDDVGDACDVCPFDALNDADGDGVCGDVDQCPNSDLSETVVIDECNSGVTNTLFLTGCTISDLIAECAEGASIHGQFVTCVTNLTIDLNKAGIITGLQEGAIVSCAARAGIP